MFNISQYLEKFKLLGQNERRLKEIVIQILKDKLGLNLDTKNIIFKNGEIILNISPTFKSAVFIKKGLLLKEIQEKTGQKIFDLK